MSSERQASLKPPTPEAKVPQKISTWVGPRELVWAFALTCSPGAASVQPTASERSAQVGNLRSVLLIGIPPARRSFTTCAAAPRRHHRNGSAEPASRAASRFCGAIAVGAVDEAVAIVV